jgi:TATA-box binding protein (TBP) (component of TFIID and TFIIIB)
MYGDLILNSTMVITGGTSTVFMSATSGTQKITGAGQTLDFPINFNGAGGTRQLQDALTIGSTRTTTLTRGTLDLNNFVLTTGIVSSSTSEVRAIAFGTGKIVLTGNAATIFTTSTATNLTVTGTNPLIQSTYSGSTGTRTFILGAAGETNAISLDVNAGSDTISLQTTAGAYKNVSFVGFTGTYTQTGTIYIYGNWNWGGVTTNSSTTTINFQATSGTKTITSNSKSFGGNVVFDGAGGTWTLQDAFTSGSARTVTLTAGTLDLSSYTLTTGLFSSSNSNIRTLAFGTGNIVVTGNAATVWSNGTSANMTITGTAPLVQATYSGSTGTRVFTAGYNDEATSISLEITAGSDSISLASSTSFYKNISFSGFTGTYATTGTTVALYGNWNWGGVTTNSSTAITTFSATSGTKTVTSNGKSFGNDVTFNGVGGTFELQDALTISLATATLSLNGGTLDFKNFTVTSGKFSASSSNVRTLAFGTGKIVVTGNNSTVCTTNTGTNLTITGSKRVELTYSGSVGQRAISGVTLAQAIEGTNLLDYFITAGTDIVNFNGARSYGTIDFSNGGTSTFTTPGSWLIGAVDIYGNLILNSTMVVSSGTSTIEMRATSGTKTITSAGQTIDFPLNINGLGGTFACSDALTLGSTRSLTMRDGTLQLKAGVTSTVGSFATVGTNQRFLQSTTPGTQATISQASGTVSVSYLTIQDSNATGGATWQAYASNFNINAGNNTGWDGLSISDYAIGAAGNVSYSLAINLTGASSMGAVGTVSIAARTFGLTGDLAVGNVGDVLPVYWKPINDTQTASWEQINTEN